MVHSSLIASPTYVAAAYSIESRKITKRTVKERAAKVLELVQRCAAAAPEVRLPHRPHVQAGSLTVMQVLDGDLVEKTGDRQSGREIMTKVASESIVLLKNEGALLPLKPKVGDAE